MADDATGIVLEIPQTVLDNLKVADAAIKKLEQTSKVAANNIKNDFGTTMVGGVDAFIKKIQEAQKQLGGLKMPAGGDNVSAVISGLATAMGALNQNMPQKPDQLTKLAEAIAKLKDVSFNPQGFQTLASAITQIGNTSQQTIANVKSLSTAMVQLAQNVKAVDAAEKKKNASKGSEEYARVATEIEKQTAKYVQLSAAIEAYQKKKREDTSFVERSQNAANEKELATLQQSLRLLGKKLAIMEQTAKVGSQANNPTLDERKSQIELRQMSKMYAEEEKASAKEAARIKREMAQLDREAAKQAIQEEKEKAKIAQQTAKESERATKRNHDQQQKLYNELFGKGGLQDRQLATPQNAIDYAKNARSLREMQAAYKNLKAVMSTVDPKSKEWEQMNRTLGQTKNRIDEVREKMGELKNNHAGLNATAQQLKRSLVAVFSVSAIKGYIEKMIQVRAQFELQQTALRAIIQDKQKADQVFQQVQQLAMQSPFSIMQMVTFTKQLAAYRIESEKLVGTTKMLADVSAGLGVDMARLILAYGQVKSANYLRACLGKGTKVKMFDGTYKNVEDVVVGDVLMGDDEQPRHVSRLYQGQQQMYRVSYLGGEFRCNEHHILTVYDALNMRIKDVFVLDYLQEHYRYHGVRRINGEYKSFIMRVEPDNFDTYYGFTIDGNHRFIVENDIVTHNTEVRQFTEAGLNIAGELATYFTEVEGKMVNVGDVMERITKRLVRFEDVEEVFNRVTSASGLFYDMQKKQSETLWGQLQRIKDATSIMFNEIGKSNSGTINALLKTIRALINDWRTFAPYINTATFATATWLVTAKGIPAIVSMLKAVKAAWISVTAATKAADAAQKSAAASNPYAALLTALVTVVTLVWQWVSAQSALNEEFDRITAASNADMWNLITTYEKNAEAVRDSTKAYSERKKALEELQRVFKDILPSEALELEYIQRTTDAQDEAINAIKAYSAEKAKAAAQDAINTEQEKKWSEWIDELKDELDGGIGGVSLSELVPALEGQSDSAIRGIVGNIALQIREEFEKGMIQTATQGYGRFIEILQKRFGEVATGTRYLTDAYGTGLRRFFDKADLYSPDANLADVMAFSKGKVEEFEKQYEKTGVKMTEIDKAHITLLKAYQNKYTNVMNDLLQKMQQVEKARAEGADPKTIQAVTGELKATFGQLNMIQDELHMSKTEWKEIYDATESNTTILRTFRGILNDIVGKFVILNDPGRRNSFISGWLQSLLGSATDISDAQKDIIDASEKIIATHKLEKNTIDKLRISEESNYSSVAQSAHDLAEARQSEIDKIKVIRAAEIARGKSAEEAQKIAESRVGITEDLAKREKTAWDEVASSLGYVEKSRNHGGKGQDAELARWKNIKKAIEDANAAWDKYRKKYDVKTTNNMVADEYSSMFTELGVNINDFYKNGKFEASELIKALQVLQGMIKQTTTPRKTFFAEMTRDINKTKVEIGLEVREDEIKNFQQSIENMFNNYELSKTFADLGVDIDVVYTLGGKPTTLEKLEQDLADMRKKIGGKEGAEDELKAIEDGEKKLRKLQQDNDKARAKNYVKYLAESLDERAQIEFKATREANKIQNDPTLDAFSKEQAINNIRLKMKEDLAKADLKGLQSSRLYIDIFQDMDRASKKELQYVIDRIKALIEANKKLDPEQLKGYTDALTQAQERLASKEGDSFKGFFEDFGKVIEYNIKRNDLIKERIDLTEQENNLRDKATTLSTQIGEESLKLNSIEDTSSDAYKDQSVKVGSLKAEYQDVLNEIKKIQDKLGVVNDSINKGENATKITKQRWSDIEKTLNATSSAIGDASEGLTAMGLGSDALMDSFSSAQEIIGASTQIGSGAIQAFTDPSPWGKLQGAIQAVGGAIKLIGAIAAIGDKKKEREIQRLQEKIEGLQKAYEKLQTAMEDAFSFDLYNAGYNKSLKNLQEQRNATEEQLALERSKKNSDKKKIKEFEDSIDELNEKMKELKESRYEAMGSLSDSGIFSESEDWVDGWLEAYKESGDGIDALMDKWQEFFEALVIKQAASAVVSKRMKKYIDMINNAIDSGKTGLEMSQIVAEVGNKFKDEMAKTNEELKEFFDAAGITAGSGELLLSDLQKGIQNITEAQAAAIEAYLNSMRFAVFEQNNILTSMLSAIQAQYNTNNSDLVLSEIKTIRGLVSSIDDRLSRVIVSRSSTSSGYIMRVG